MGLFDSDNNYKYIGTKKGVATIFDDADISGADAGSISGTVNQDSSGFGLGNISGSQLGGYAQLGGFALGAYDDLLGIGGKTKKQQLSNMKKSSVLLDQEIANNTQSMADRKAFNEGMADASRQAMGLGTVYNYDKK